MKRKKLKLKKQAYYIFAGIIAIFVAIILGVNFYNDLKYKESDEAKLITIGYTCLLYTSDAADELTVV